MKDHNVEFTPCPICKSIVKIDVAWAKKNERVFCNSCGKAFDISIEDEEEKPAKKEHKSDTSYW